MNDPLRLGVLVSGNGTNLQALLDAIAQGELLAKILAVVSNKKDAFALERAKRAGIPAFYLDPKKFQSREEYDEALARIFLERNVELVVLAGFMRILSIKFLQYFPNRVINVHPALLPEDPEKEEVLLPDGSFSKVFRGKDAVKQALEAGVAWSGCTIHLVTEKVDCGPILERAFVPVISFDTLESLHTRIQKEEHRLLPKAIKAYGKKLKKTASFHAE
jgi:phosphoribosylglycinamide formyltransferase-1